MSEPTHPGDHRADTDDGENSDGSAGGSPGLDPQAQPVAGGSAEGEPAQGEGAPDSY